MSWLVVSTPLKNISHLGIIIINIWENKTCSKPPTRCLSWVLIDFMVHLQIKCCLHLLVRAVPMPIQQGNGHSEQHIKNSMTNLRPQPPSKIGSTHASNWLQQMKYKWTIHPYQIQPGLPNIPPACYTFENALPVLQLDTHVVETHLAKQ